MESNEPKAAILIVEDERGPREVLEMVLRPFFRIYSAETGQEVLNLLERERIDIVTLDMHLPGYRGTELLNVIRERRPDVDLILITGDSGSGVREAMNSYNIAGFILKPFDIEELMTVVNGTLERRRGMAPREDNAPGEPESARTVRETSLEFRNPRR